MDTNGDREALPPLWPFLTLCAALAAWVDLGSFHQDHSGDSIVPVLTSLYRWTPYYWNCNRIGMLVPLLTRPFSSPFTTLLVQAGLVLFAGFATFFLLSRYMFRTPSWPLAGAIGVLLFLLLPRGTRFLATFGQPHYVVGMALGLGGLLIADKAAARSRPGWSYLAGAVSLLLLAHWVNSATTAILAPLVVFRWLFAAAGPGMPEAREPIWLWRLSQRETVLALAVLAIGGSWPFVSRLMFPCYEDPIASALAPVQRWPGAWLQLARGTWEAVADRGWAAVVAASPEAVVPGAAQPRWPLSASLACAAGLLVLIPAVRRRSAGVLRAAGGLLAGTAVYAAFTGTLTWTLLNLYHWKYWIPVVLSLGAAAGVAATAALTSFSGSRLRRALCAAVAPALLLAATGAYGLPSRSRVRTDLEETRGPSNWPKGNIASRVAAMLANRCTHVAGHYDPVWLTVFLANLKLYERGEDRVVWGLATRCVPTWDLWGRMPPEDLRVAALTLGEDIDPEADFYLKAACPPLTLVAREPGVWVYRPSGEVALARGERDAPVAAAWHGGFYFFEGTAESNNRWCGNSGKLTLTNSSGQACSMTLDMRLVTGGPRPANLWIEGRGLSDHLWINDTAGHYTRTLTVPPGRLTLRFECDAAPCVLAPDDWRHTVFRVADFRMTKLPGSWSPALVP
jgi:hypothetical protein